MESAEASLRDKLSQAVLLELDALVAAFEGEQEVEWEGSNLAAVIRDIAQMPTSVLSRSREQLVRRWSSSRCQMGAGAPSVSSTYRHSWILPVYSRRASSRGVSSRTAACAFRV